MLSKFVLPGKKPKDFTTLWREQQRLNASTPTSPPAHRSHQSRYVPSVPGFGSFASSHIAQQLYGSPDDVDQKARERANAIVNLDQAMHGWLQAVAPSRLDTALVNMDRTLSSMKARY